MNEAPYTSLEEEAGYWNNEYYRCFGHPPSIPIAIGVDYSVVHGVMSAVQRYYVEKMKKAVGE